MSLHSNESKREEYHRYLEKSGVIEYFSHVLVALYETPEKPADPNEFIREQLSAAFPDDSDDLRKQITTLEEKLIDRENSLRDLQQEQYELRLVLETKGIKFEDIDFKEEEEEDDVEPDNDGEYDNELDDNDQLIGSDELDNQHHDEDSINNGGQPKPPPNH